MLPGAEKAVLFLSRAETAIAESRLDNLTTQHAPLSDKDQYKTRNVPLLNLTAYLTFTKRDHINILEKDNQRLFYCAEKYCSSLFVCLVLFGLTFQHSFF